MASNSQGTDRLRSITTRLRSITIGANPPTSKQKTRKQKVPKLLNQVSGVNTVTHIIDHFDTYEDVRRAMRDAGLERCSLIFGIDYTSSNNFQGKLSFGGHSLHSLEKGVGPNPYQQVIAYLGETLEEFDEDGLIPAFGFGDTRTRDHSVFPMKGQDGVCEGFADVLDAYAAVTPSVRMSGPTNFAPLIEKAMEIVKNTNQYHILVIVADGQVLKEEETYKAIVDASNYALSIVMVGVGDGPWDMMNDFDDRIEGRQFDNFNFVDFHRVINGSRKPQAAFALHALMEIPDQYKLIKKLKLLKNQ